MTTYLITGIGGDIAQGVARILREVRPAARLVGTDTHEQHAGSRFVDAFCELPRASDPDYPERLQALMGREQVDVAFPMTEPELDVWAAEKLEAPRVQWFACGREAIRIGNDKLLTAQFIAAQGLPAPWTVAADVVPSQFPCFFKPRRGSGSRGLFVARDAREASFLGAKYPDSVFQELLQPDDGEVTCAVFRGRDGATRVLQLRRRLVGGLTGWAEVIAVPEVETQCRALAQALGATGCLNVQLRLTAGGPRVFEINARVSSTALMRHRLGFRDVEWALDELEGRAPAFASVAAGRRAARTFDVTLLD